MNSVTLTPEEFFSIQNSLGEATKYLLEYTQRTAVIYSTFNADGHLVTVRDLIQQVSKELEDVFNRGQDSSDG